ncbi:cytochrome c [Rhizobium sp. S152]|uniref:c-type cytochrome n=1 Tax=Rhizobium sp. S152 TaxID=3055038 RepID=UPI0025A95768|nr:cytochrome c [Rhizobium sp. S152]MDM9627523.1 cytochrome c [Rhizobium sp. S152]
MQFDHPNTVLLTKRRRGFCAKNDKLYQLGREMKLTRKFVTITLGGALLAAVTVGSFAIWYVYEPEIEKIARPDRNSFDPAIVRRGEQLATVGDCIVCHTSENGVPFAGARPLPTPFGTLYSNNITPDEATGIGNWSEEAFSRAMKRGVARDGSHLYPALPYEHFTHVSKDDLHALYAFLMTRQPVSQLAPENNLLPGLGFRPLLAGWKMLFLHESEFEAVAGQSDEWNRGRYLVDGLAHCGGCHTPRNLAGGEERGNEFAGGVAEGWNAPPLNSSNPSAKSWTTQSLYNYLKTGFDRGHGAAAGPMGPVAEGLSNLNDPDVRSIAVYVSSIMGVDKSKRADAPELIDNARAAADRHPEGAMLFQGACAGCHEPGSAMSQQGRPALSDLTTLKMDDPTNAAAALLQGVAAPPGKSSFMPSFAQNMTDKQLADLLAYVRTRFSNQPDWKNVEKSVASARSEE